MPHVAPFFQGIGLTVSMNLKKFFFSFDKKKKKIIILIIKNKK